MLRASRRILKPGGRTAFLVIEPVTGLDDRLRRRAARVGPVRVSVRTSYPSLLATAGFTEITEDDITAEFRRTQLGWTAAFAARETELTEAIDPDELEKQRRARQQVVLAIDEGILRRTLYTAIRPPAGLGPSSLFSRAPDTRGPETRAPDTTRPHLPPVGRLAGRRREQTARGRPGPAGPRASPPGGVPRP